MQRRGGGGGGLAGQREEGERGAPVATMTTQSGERPLERHLMFMNFSAPMSAPKPASVTTSPSGPTSLRAIRSATTDEFPWAMLAKGPAPPPPPPPRVRGPPRAECMRVSRTAQQIRATAAPDPSGPSCALSCRVSQAGGGVHTPGCCDLLPTRVVIGPVGAGVAASRYPSYCFRIPANFENKFVK